MAPLKHAIPLAITLVVGGALGAGATRLPSHPIALNGHDWTAMEPAARGAYLAGFIAGAAAHQATGGAASVTGAAAAARASRLRTDAALAFPFASNVYRSHLDDYYFYTNRRRQTLLEVLVDVNGHLRERR